VQDGDVNVYGCPGHFSILGDLAKCFMMLAYCWCLYLAIALHKSLTDL